MINLLHIAIARDAEFLFLEPDGEGYIIVVTRIQGKIDIRRFYWDEDQERYRPTSKAIRLTLNSVKRIVDGLLIEVLGES